METTSLKTGVYYFHQHRTIRLMISILLRYSFIMGGPGLASSKSHPRRGKLYKTPPKHRRRLLLAETSTDLCSDPRHWQLNLTKVKKSRFEGYWEKQTLKSHWEEPEISDCACRVCSSHFLGTHIFAYCSKLVHLRKWFTTPPQLKFNSILILFNSNSIQ